jgi:hypothetical protein
MLEIGSDRWNARLYAGLSISSEMAANLNGSRNLTFRLLEQWKIFHHLGQMNRILGETLLEFDQFAERFKDGSVQDFRPSEDYRAFRDSTLRQFSIHARLVSQFRGLRQNLLMRKRLDRFEAFSERLLDMADWLDAMSSPEETRAKFDAALEELSRGEVVPWSAVQ